MDELFSKTLPVILKYPEKEQRRTHVQLTIELHTVVNPTTRKELVVRLTDGKDSFFLYTLRLSEEDFQSLKVQQGLLVDFQAFPQSFVSLLDLCAQEEHKESPKYILDLTPNGSGPGCTANLSVIETNAFKHLTHLCLKFLPGTDSDIKKYLADCLSSCKDQNRNLLQRLQTTQADLSQQLQSSQELLAARSKELEALRSDWTNQNSTLSVEHKQELTSEREKAVQNQSQLQQRYEKERREADQEHGRVVTQLQTRIHELEGNDKDLVDKKYKNESTIREQKTRITTLEEETQRLRQDLTTLRKDNSSLDAYYHDHEKTINKLKTNLAVLEQEVKDKDVLVHRTTELLNLEKDHKKNIEEEVERKKRQMAKFETNMKSQSDDLTKANEIIKKYQNDIKSYHAKLKLKGQVVAQQEKLLNEKHQELEEIRKDLGTVKSSLRLKDEENKKLSEELEICRKKVEESKATLQSNENIIQWMNKKLTEQQLSNSTPAAGPFEMNSTINSTASYRGMNNMNSSVPAVPGLTSLPASARSDMSSLQSYSTGYQPHPHPARHQVHFQGGSSGRPGGRGSPRAEAIQEEPTKVSPKGFSRNTSDVALDPKYLQHSGSHAVQGTSSGSMVFPSDKLPTTSSSPRVNGQAAPGNAVAGSTRLSRDVIIHGKTASTAHKLSAQAPPLASAYFPGQNRLT